MFEGNSLSAIDGNMPLKIDVSYRILPRLGITKLLKYNVGIAADIKPSESASISNVALLCKLHSWHQLDVSHFLPIRQDSTKQAL